MKFWGIVVGVLGGLGVVGFLILVNLHNGEVLTAPQKQQALTNLLGRAPVLTPVDHTSWKLYKSHVFSFQYPAWAIIYVKDNDTAKKQQNTLDSFHFDLPDQHIQGVISATEHPGFGTIHDEPGVGLRMEDKDYMELGTLSAISVQFFNQTIMERSFFLLKNSRVYAIVVSGGGDSENKEVFEKIYSSLVTE